MKIARGQHLSVLGINGSGKSFGVRNAYLPLFQQIIVADTEEADFEDFPTVSAKRAVKLANSKYAFAVKVPFSGSMSESDMERLDELCYGVLRRPKDGATSTSDLPAVCVYFDEITDFSDPSTIPHSLKALIRKGRKRGITVITATQRPQGLNKWFLSNSQHRVYYYLSDFDSARVHDYAPFLEERMREIPYLSFRSLYQAPGGEVIVLAPIAEYDWSKRTGRKKK